MELDRALALIPAGQLTDVRLDLLSNRASASLQLGDTAAARANWREALTIQPTLANAALNLARLDASSGRLAHARATLEHFLARVPDSPDALALLVRVEWVTGNVSTAEAVLARLDTLDRQQALRLRDLLRSR